MFGSGAALFLKQGLLTTTSPYLDHFEAINTGQKKLWLLLMNNDDETLSSSVHIDYSKVFDNKTIGAKKVFNIDAAGKKQLLNTSNDWNVSIPAYGIEVIEIEY